MSQGRAKLAEGMASEVAERLLMDGVETAKARCTQAQQVIISLKEAPTVSCLHGYMPTCLHAYMCMGTLPPFYR